MKEKLTETEMIEIRKKNRIQNRFLLLLLKLLKQLHPTRCVSLK